MRLLHLAAHLSNKLLQKRMHQQKDIRLFKYWQILYCIQTNPGKLAEEYGSLLGVDVSKIYRIVQLYNRHGADFDKALQWGGRREQRSLLTMQQESELMDTFKQKALQGKIITINDIRRIIENKTAQPVSDDYLWDLFKRHGWKKKAPRPQHPQKNSAAQQLFKKNSPNYWIPVSKD